MTRRLIRKIDAQGNPVLDRDGKQLWVEKPPLEKPPKWTVHDGTVEHTVRCDTFRDAAEKIAHREQPLAGAQYTVTNVGNGGVRVFDVSVRRAEFKAVRLS